MRGRDYHGNLHGNNIGMILRMHSEYKTKPERFSCH